MERTFPQLDSLAARDLPSTRVTTSILKNLKWGLRWGLTMAVGFTVIALFASIGRYLDPSAASEPSLASLVGFYFIAGICGGLLLGLLRPIAKHKTGALFIGTAVVALYLALLDYLFYAATDGWRQVDTILVVLGALFGGPAATLIIWYVRARRGTGSSGPQDLRQ